VTEIAQEALDPAGSEEQKALFVRSAALAVLEPVLEALEEPALAVDMVEQSVLILVLAGPSVEADTQAADVVVRVAVVVTAGDY